MTTLTTNSNSKTDHFNPDWRRLAHQKLMDLNNPLSPYNEPTNNGFMLPSPCYQPLTVTQGFPHSSCGADFIPIPFKTQAVNNVKTLRPILKWNGSVTQDGVTPTPPKKKVDWIDLQAKPGALGVKYGYLKDPTEKTAEIIKDNTQEAAEPRKNGNKKQSKGFLQALLSWFLFLIE